MNIPSTKSTILFLVNAPEFFLSHRLSIATAAKKKGYDVHVATANGDSILEIENYGLKHHVIPISRSGINPIYELYTLASIIRLYIKIQPNLVHMVSIKPIIYGGIAARLMRIRSVVFAISGLGYVFVDESHKASILRYLVRFLYKFALGQKNMSAIFHNFEDRDMFLKFYNNPFGDSSQLTRLKPEKASVIRGSGIDLNKFSYHQESKNQKPFIVMVSRLLKEKGILDFTGAARIIKNRGCSANFCIVGDLDYGNPSSLSESELSELKNEKIVEFIGYKENIFDILSSSNIVVLPSYREGLPKILIEAAACGRATVTTDVPGCRDAIEPDKTGILVPVRDTTKLADAIEKLINNPEMRIQYGKAGRELAEKEFNIETVIQKHLVLYKKLLSSN